jgi:hypothetical protein
MLILKYSTSVIMDSMSIVLFLSLVLGAADISGSQSSHLQFQAVRAIREDEYFSEITNDFNSSSWQ